MIWSDQKDQRLLIWSDTMFFSFLIKFIFKQWLDYFVCPLSNITWRRLYQKQKYIVKNLPFYFFYKKHIITQNRKDISVWGIVIGWPSPPFQYQLNDIDQMMKFNLDIMFWRNILGWDSPKIPVCLLFY